ncbi:transmembrane protein 241 [Protopterus annectens]|uniref:transmembrane protein 241 n=1 Tax=Protopterus annectens TaxID=7888 RepID=UPI001CFA9F0F|nr:transmembrane protein 241 [Protopterus annectens]
MLLKRPVLGFFFCIVYLNCYVVNKYVLSVLKFTYPTLFQGWQTLVGGLLLHVTWKTGFVEVGNFTRSAVLSWLPGSVLFVGIIYAGSRALSRLPIPIFFTFHNASEVFASLTRWFICKESASPTKFLSLLLLVIAATCLPYYDAQKRRFSLGNVDFSWLTKP